MPHEPDSRYLRLVWWNLQGPNAARAERQINRILSLRPRPHVIAVCELKRDTAEFVTKRLRPDYEVVTPLDGVRPEQRRVMLASRLRCLNPLPLDRFRIPADHAVPAARDCRVWPRAVCSAKVTLAGQAIEIHAAHVPNGSRNGWVKIDHLWAVRYGLEHSELPQILCGDFNTPRWESGKEIFTFGQNRDGTLRSGTSSDPPYSEERPWEAAAWNEGERAVLVGVPDELQMPDVFRELHPRARGFTWAPHGREHLGRRLDHVFASRELSPIRCRHIGSWRRPGLSDHCPIDVTFELRGPNQR